MGFFVSLAPVGLSCFYARAVLNRCRADWVQSFTGRSWWYHSPIPLCLVVRWRCLLLVGQVSAMAERVLAVAEAASSAGPRCLPASVLRRVVLGGPLPSF